MKSVNITNKVELTESFEESTLLFADIAGFTAYSSTVIPEKVVEMVKELFTECDKMCLKLGIYKLYTIGDCYVAMGFNDVNDQSSKVKMANNIVLMGFAMIEIIKSVREKIKFPGLSMRIGIHTVNFISIIFSIFYIIINKFFYKKKLF